MTASSEDRIDAMAPVPSEGTAGAHSESFGIPHEAESPPSAMVWDLAVDQAMKFFAP